MRLSKIKCRLHENSKIYRSKLMSGGGGGPHVQNTRIPPKSGLEKKHIVVQLYKKKEKKRLAIQCISHLAPSIILNYKCLVIGCAV